MGHADARPERLPPPAELGFLRGWPAEFLCRPWFDALALHSVTRWYLPLSRGWAAGVIPEIERAARNYREADERWQTAFFGEADPGAASLVACERSRVEAAHAFMASRRHFVRRRRSLPAVRWSIVPPAEVERVHGARLDDETDRFPAPEPSGIVESRRVRGALGPEYWLRFPATVAGRADTAWAHVYEPENAPARATFIFLHGIAMETEMWRPVSDPVNALVAQGIRVVRPEGPWHGRRCLPGWYGGEPVLARGVAGFIELFQAWLAELALLVLWARRSGSTRVAVGGVSLGALAAQLAACAARCWPAGMQPDALFLVATSGDLVTAARRGDLAQALGAGARLAAAGWDEPAMGRWRPLLEPEGDPVMGGGHAVMVLGTADGVTPFAGGHALACRWRLPDGNLFLRRQGHFSVAFGLWRDPAPLYRLCALLLG